jgi:hypothetical protein
MKEQQDPRQKPQSNNALKYSGMAFQMAVIISLGVFGGVKLDGYLNLNIPIFTLILSLLSVGVAIYLSIKDFIKKK